MSGSSLLFSLSCFSLSFFPPPPSFFSLSLCCCLMCCVVCWSPVAHSRRSAGCSAAPFFYVFSVARCCAVQCTSKQKRVLRAVSLFLIPTDRPKNPQTPNPNETKQNVRCFLCLVPPPVPGPRSPPRHFFCIPNCPSLATRHLPPTAIPWGFLLSPCALSFSLHFFFSFSDFRSIFSVVFFLSLSRVSSISVLPAGLYPPVCVFFSLTTSVSCFLSCGRYALLFLFSLRVCCFCLPGVCFPSHNAIRRVMCSTPLKVCFVFSFGLPPPPVFIRFFVFRSSPSSEWFRCFAFLIDLLSAFLNSLTQTQPSFVLSLFPFTSLSLFGHSSFFTGLCCC